VGAADGRKITRFTGIQITNIYVDAGDKLLLLLGTGGGRLEKTA
jgi:hypothetical protein